MSSIPPTLVQLVRHGQTDQSVAGRFCGRLDVPLNAAGIAMAEALARRFASLPDEQRPQIIYSSPMERTRQTAAYIGVALGLEPYYDKALREIDLGDWEGQLEHEVAVHDKARYDAWIDEPDRIPPPGNGENAFAIAARIVPCFQRIITEHAGGRILIVTHKAAMRVLLCAQLGIPVGRFRVRFAPPVASVTTLEVGPYGAMLKSLGDVSHLPPELAGMGGT